MILSLHIENVAVIKSIDIDFTKGFSVFTGETGAGKSVIIDCIALLLGSRFDKTLLRRGEEKAAVGGLFGNLGKAAIEELADNGISIDDDGSIHVLRTFTQDGHSAVKINGQSVSVTVLRNVMSSVMSILGQNESFALSDRASQMAILDAFAGNRERLAAYLSVYEEYTKKKRELSELKESLSEKERMIDIYKYQKNEIDALKLKIGEEEILEDRSNKLKNLEKITKHTSFVYKALKGGERANAIYILERTKASLEALSDIIEDASDLSEEITEIIDKINDIAEDVRSYSDGIEGNPAEFIDKIEGRLDAISRLKKKYGGSIEEIIEYKEKISKKLEMYENSDDIIEDLRNDLRLIENELTARANLLHESRIKFAKQLEEGVLESLEFLDMPRVKFSVRVKTNDEGGRLAFDRCGYDSVSFMISANAGLEEMPIDKIASGGELSRIMLSIKSVLSDSDGIGTVVYDEIDAGVSGKTARKIGIKLKHSAENSQVLCVTHSAQIASLANSHFLISKADADGSVRTSVALLDSEGRIEELSRILGGINVTDSQRMAAIDMLMGDEVF